MKKTNAARILDKSKINYELFEYEVDENDLSATHLAETSGLDVKKIFKTLVTINEKNEPIVAIIAADDELDLKALAINAKCKKCTMIAVKDINKLTGYIRGGCSPLGMKKNYPTFIDTKANSHENIYISAGIRGMQICLNPKDLLKACSGTFVKITMDR